MGWASSSQEEGEALKTLFGIPLPDLALALLGLMGAILLLVALIALRQRVIFKLGIRNIARRLGQSALIITGLTLSTIIITSTLGVGDTQAHALRSQMVVNLGMIDELVLGPVQWPRGEPLMTQAQYEALRQQLASDEQIDGIAPLFRRDLAIVAPSGLGEPKAMIFATDETYDQGFGGFISRDGQQLLLNDLADDEVYLNSNGAAALEVAPGNTINLQTGEDTVTVRVKAIVRNQGLLGVGRSVVVMRLDQAHALYNAAGELSAMLVSNVGGVEDSIALSDAVTSRIRLLVTRVESADKIRELLATPDISKLIEDELHALTSVQSPNQRLIDQVQLLQSELRLDYSSDQLRNLLADSDIANWVLTLPIGDTLRAELKDEFGRLSQFQVNDVKAQALAEADQQGNVFFNLFLLNGTFAIVVGLLLIFLIFVMLVTERKVELGMARAVGLQRSHLIQSLLTEGLGYSILAALLGTGLGVLICWVMIWVLAGALNHFQATNLQPELELRLTMSPYSVIVSFGLGLILTFVTVVISAWNVSRLNIVAAIRNLPEKARKPGKLRLALQFVGVLLLILLGTTSISSSYSVQQLSLLFSGISFLILGAGMFAMWVVQLTPLRDHDVSRIVYTAMGLALVMLWMFPLLWHPLLGSASFEGGTNFFLSAGLFGVMGGIWLLTFNTDILLRVLNAPFGLLGQLTPVMKIATAYSLLSRLRTGMTLAMFSLISFFLVMLAMINSANDAIFADDSGITGGFDLAATFNPDSQIDDFRSEIAKRSTIDPEAIEVVVGAAQGLYQVRQLNASNQNWHQFPLAAVEPLYYEQVAGNYTVAHVPSFPDDASVWKALRERDDVVLLIGNNVPSRQFHIKPQGNYEVEGGFIEDKTLPDYTLELRVPGTNQTRRVQVVGALKMPFTLPFVAILTNQATVEALTGAVPQPNTYVIKTAPDADNEAITRELKRAFLSDGVQVVNMHESIIEVEAGNAAINTLSRGFLALGFVVGIAGLGVIASWSVYERRQQIGMLRAIGYQRQMVLLSFLIESSFVALLGLILGTTLGSLLGVNIIADLTQQIGSQLEFTPPWRDILLIIGSTYIFSVLATFLPAHQASKIYPAEALRYD